MSKICDMVGVREYAEGYPVELGRDDESGRLVIRATNECGCNCTDIDLQDIVAWLAGAGHRLVLAHGLDTDALRVHSTGDTESA